MEEENTEQTQTPADISNTGSIKDLLIPSGGFFITPILIYLNIAVFIIMAVSGVSIFEPTTGDLLDWGANLRSATLDGQYWRLLTCCFLHIGIIHLLFNMYALMYIGMMLEPILGRTRFLVAYLLTGIAASAASLFWHDLTVSAGASGAIFGMYGLFLALLTTKLIPEESRNALLSSIAVFVGYNLLMGFRDGVDNAAHVGGLVSGFIGGYIFLPSIKSPEKPGLLYGALGVFTALVFGSTGLVLGSVDNNVGQFNTLYGTFATEEQQAIAAYKMPNETSDEDAIKLLNESTAHWKKAMNTIVDMQKMDIPDPLRVSLPSLFFYTNTRIKFNNEQIAFIQTRDTTHLVLSNNYNHQIDSVLSSLNQPPAEEEGDK